MKSTEMIWWCLIQRLFYILSFVFYTKGREEMSCSETAVGLPIAVHISIKGVGFTSYLWLRCLCPSVTGSFFTAEACGVRKWRKKNSSDRSWIKASLRNLLAAFTDRNKLKLGTGSSSSKFWGSKLHITVLSLTRILPFQNFKLKIKPSSPPQGLSYSPWHKQPLLHTVKAWNTLGTMQL